MRRRGKKEKGAERLSMIIDARGAEALTRDGAADSGCSTVMYVILQLVLMKAQVFTLS